MLIRRKYAPIIITIEIKLAVAQRRYIAPTVIT
jgi:hypothetical protein